MSELKSSQTKRSAEAGGQRAAEPLMPLVDVVEDKNGIVLYADLPGVPKDRLVVQVDGEQLIIEGDIVLPIPDGMEATHAEVTEPRYRRVFSLSKELDSEQVQAEFLQGELVLRIPKKAHAQPRRVEVRVA